MLLNIKYCKQYLTNSQLKSYFVFLLKNNHKCNYNVIVDIMYIKGKPILYLVDKTTQI